MIGFNSLKESGILQPNTPLARCSRLKKKIVFQARRMILKEPLPGQGGYILWFSPTGEFFKRITKKQLKNNAENSFYYNILTYIPFKIMINKIKTFFLFDGQAEEAINFYVSLFKNSEIIDIRYYSSDEMGVEGTVQRATFSLGGQHFMAIDSNFPQDFTFNPSMSLFVDCETEEEINSLFSELTAHGTILMPLNNYGFSSKFAWLTDSFGISWQLNLK